MGDLANWEHFLVFIEGTLVEKLTWEILDFRIDENNQQKDLDFGVAAN